jgi:hypothetical protein
MARPRLPQSKAEVSGATAKNPGRFADRKAVRRVRPLGEPYAPMTEIERKYWAEFAQELPWLHSGHRVLLRLACHFSARMDAGEIGISAAHALSQLLSKLGATPVDETKVNHADGDDEDAADRFFSRPN